MEIDDKETYKQMAKIYTNKNVYEAAIERINYVFDNYEKIVISFSGGKDSTVMTYLVLEVAKKRNRKVYCFFLDQEFEYDSTILHVDEIMKLDNIIPVWFQIAGILPTPVHHEECWLYTWDESKRDMWVRQQKRIAIKKIDWQHKVKFSYEKEKMFGFYGFMKCMEQMFKGENVAHFVGLRAEESLNRFRAVTKHAGVDDIMWSTKTNDGGIRFYPMYDWTFSDLWVYISKNKLRYNKMYDFFIAKALVSEKCVYHH